MLLDDRDLPVGLSLIPAAQGTPDQVGVEALLRGLGLQPVHLADGGWQAETPLGTARLPPSEVRTLDGVDYAGLPALSRALGIGLRFDPTAAAIVATTAWSLAPRAEAPPPTAEVIRPDPGALAPTTSLSYWRTEAYFSHGDGTDSAYGSSDVGGGLAGGFWRARYEDDLADQRRLLDYAWVRTTGSRRWLLGHQQINSHPLLGSIELTGAQMAWTNVPDRMYTGNLDEGELVSGRTAPASNIVGTGPIGGIAELRFDGIVVARVPVALDGRYEFRDIPLSHGTSTRVEVALYENGLGVPVRVEDHSGQASDQLLPQGAVLHYFGAGRHGNPLDPDEIREGGAAFYEARYGALPGLTLDLIGQHVDGRDTWLIGGVFSLGVAGVYSAHVARSGERQAWHFDGEGFRGNTYWRLLARDEDVGFRGGTVSAAPGSLYERHVEAGWRGEHWALSLVGRDLDVLGASEPVRYLKPGVDWFPTQNLYFSARPDLSGRYQYSASWAMTPRLRAGAYLSFESDRYELEYQISDRWRSSQAAPSSWAAPAIRCCSLATGASPATSASPSRHWRARATSATWPRRMRDCFPASRCACRPATIRWSATADPSCSWGWSPISRSRRTACPPASTAAASPTSAASPAHCNCPAMLKPISRPPAPRSGSTARVARPSMRTAASTSANWPRGYIASASTKGRCRSRCG